MLQETTYKEKFQILKKWMPEIIDSVKKDLKNEHLKKDWMFAKKYFAGKNLNKITNAELAQGYESAIREEEKGEDIAEYISNCWLLKNSDLYHYFEEELKKINPDFAAIKQLEASESERIANQAIEEFGAYKTYLFSVFNSVAFTQKELNHLSSLAEKECQNQAELSENRAKHDSIADVEKSYELKMARAADKYEKKILGLQKKYTQDVESLKKQLAILNAKLAKAK